MKNHENIAMYGMMVAGLECLENCREFAELIPEVRTNLVYAKEEPQGPLDVMAIEGRITIVNAKPYAAGAPKFGTSSHMARLIVELNKSDSSIRAGINFASNPSLAKWLADYCVSKDWVFSVIDRSREPDALKNEEGASMPWKIAEAVKAANGRIPKVFYETGAIGKEPVSILVGKDPVEVTHQICEIARLYTQQQRPPMKVGKIDLDTFATFLLKRLGKKDASVIVPPLTGVDAGIIDIGNGRVLVIAEDPIFSIPMQPLEMFGWYAVHIGASDVAVMGVKPKYMTYTLLMPPEPRRNWTFQSLEDTPATILVLQLPPLGGLRCLRLQIEIDT
jgi:hydroxymethylpyrimidine/phosphomethylpyrimidine kinase